jgi:hypothetical protein
MTLRFSIVLALCLVSGAALAAPRWGWIPRPRASAAAAANEWPNNTVIYLDFTVQSEVEAGLYRNSIVGMEHATQATASARCAWSNAANPFAQFDGNDYGKLSGTTSPLSSPMTNAAGCTTFFWMRVDANTPAATKTMFVCQSSGASFEIYDRMYDDRPYMQLTGEGTLYNYSLYPTAQLGKWKSIVVRRGPNVFDVWANATNILTGDGSVTWTPKGALDSASWAFGAGSGESSYYKGALDKIGCATNVLTPTQITNWHNGTKSQFW